ncbi:hypothetical protein WISP_86830 [Willisornis vidua]|uniref:Uncharacterized protein n=1 Tax=Willisornis vidua TaxID=1566151 RepID=A0ABQ9D5M2_9PASS|nr:hypothetical protein WISP_86830 [Willisornis vidua]
MSKVRGEWREEGEEKEEPGKKVKEEKSQRGVSPQNCAAEPLKIPCYGLFWLFWNQKSQKENESCFESFSNIHEVLIEYPELEMIHRDYWSSTPCPAQDSPKNYTMYLKALSKCLNSDRFGAMTTSLGSQFQCLTILQVKNLFVKSSLNLP